MTKRPNLALLALALLLIGPVSAGPGKAAGAGELPPEVANWPSFRGPHASGVVEGYTLPESWDLEKGTSVLWKTPIPGLAHSSPIIWGQKLFVTSAVSGAGEASFKHGLYGSGEASDDRSPHRFLVFCLDKETGKILWRALATEGVPRDKRHIKATYANSTPATDGRVVVAWFGSEGLFAFDLDGEPLWSKDLGRLDVGAYDAPTYEWGSASSPILFDGKVVVQVDTQGDDFLLALDAGTGEEVWRTAREELPSWGTPTLYPGKAGPEIVTNGGSFIRGYDVRSGRELWKLGGSSKITAPTPIFHGDLILVASGRRPEKPIFVIRGGSRGDLTLPEGKTSSKAIAWSRTDRGPYMPTPLIYRGLVYVVTNQGVLDVFELETGTEVYRERLSHRGGGFSASPVAADGLVYIPGEDGQVFAVAAGRKFVVRAVSDLGERVMASPALSEGALFLRGEKTLFALADR